MMRLLSIGVLVLACAISAQAGASVLLNINSSGVLKGANNVEVAGALYDVEFTDGSCIDLFAGCDEPSDFAFSTKVSADLAMESLRDQVFLDGPQGAFDSHPNMTGGCEMLLADACTVFTPYDVDVDTSGLVSAVGFVNRTDDSSDLIFSGGLIRDIDVFGGFNVFQTWAVWSPVSVPEPGSLMMLGLGIVLVTLAGNFRRRTNC